MVVTKAPYIGLAFGWTGDQEMGFKLDASDGILPIEDLREGSRIWESLGSAAI